jgi:hypothetical protein
MLLLKWLDPHKTITQINSMKPIVMTAGICFSLALRAFKS